MTVDAIETLIQAAKNIEPTPQQREEQRRSFAYGNTHVENPLITREMIDRQADKIEQERGDGSGVR